ncbi:glycosyltransferase [Paraburkholderia sp. MMS20-SJTR3]|uniref:Glycosyltransferase n=1 Tax=Paraburkholderia sejongensis TaxID=2886946 RepID=A0ABS8JPN6_9BURK|nr:glycosyltransferase [Paraburkholderia sp. MMS20-SJTR3]MCC8391797.1 glycosyltransferase [Paraburkholderia sp. MMS20-SJTR3]
MTVSAVPSVNHGIVTVSVVVFHPDQQLLARTLASLAQASTALARVAPGVSVHLYLIDNGGMPEMSESLAALSQAGIDCTVLAGHGNIGYGRGHNLAIEQANSQFHLILNPDIDIDAQALVAAHAFFDAHADTGLLAPRVNDDAGGEQYLCRRFPTLLVLLARGFLPSVLRRTVFAKRLAEYEMRDVIDGTSVVWDPPIISGCFMLFRTDVLKRIGGFDPRYFLYFEDYDLSLRTHEVARVAYVPSVTVVHHGGGASRKGSAHIRMFAASAYKFFNRFGWRLW